MRKLFILTLTFFIYCNIFGQVSIGYFPFQSILSINSNTDNLIIADIRLETNTFFSNLNPELNLLYNFKRKEKVDYFLGAGVNTNPFYKMNYLSFVNGYSFTLGARIKPFNKIEKLNVIFEISPYTNKYFDGGVFRTNLGLSYTFIKNEK